VARDSGIPWTDGTINSLVGCSKVSAGCKNCYATAGVWRMVSNPMFCRDGVNPYEGLVQQRPERGALNWTGRISFVPARLQAVLKVRKPKRYFVDSLSDLFHSEVSIEIILDHFRLFRAAHWHQFQILTKRSDRLLDMSDLIQWPDNVWMGVSVENAKPGILDRIADLGKTGARIRWVSFEPWLSEDNPLRAMQPGLRPILESAGVAWAVIGGESSRDKESARYLAVDDVRYLIEECRAVGVKVFLKQLGTRWAIASNTYSLKGADGSRLKKINAGGAPEFWPADFRDASLREYPV